MLLPYVEGLEFPQVAGFKSDPVLAFREDACPRSGFVGRTRSHAEAGDDDQERLPSDKRTPSSAFQNDR